ncbi:hypothetical protein OCD69_09815 [Bacillus paranthracis]|uniref:hypothetical protein n=1 Tax=Bacillus paranthracis TaxID=2026186 RepID=UPI0021D35ACD|nr:hypothetical protein [Bacillus paranthracis]MCU4904570.1 hypothetical protein [Bacillus paranthracis]
MYKYLMKLNDPKNRGEVIDVLDRITSSDLIDEHIVQKNIKSIATLKEIGEEQIFEMVVEDYKEMELYKEFLFVYNQS